MQTGSMRRSRATLRPLLFAWTLSLCGVAVAGDCWVSTLENMGTGFGDSITSKRYAAMRQVLRKVEALQRDDRAIGAMTGVRYQVHRYIGRPYHPGAPMTGTSCIFLHKPEAWTGKCGLKPWADNVHFASLEVKINDLTGLEGQKEPGESFSDTHFFVEPEITGRNGGHPIYERRILVMTSGHLPAWVPVTLGEYLDHWQRKLQAELDASRGEAAQLANNREMRDYIERLRKTDPKTADELRQSMDELSALAAADADPHGEWAELQRLRASLTPAQRARQVHVSNASMERLRFGVSPPDAEGARRLVKVNPALWTGRRGEQSVRVMTLEVFVNDGDSATRAGADTWLERVDTAPYRVLLEG